MTVAKATLPTLAEIRAALGSGGKARKIAKPLKLAGRWCLYGTASADSATCAVAGEPPARLKGAVMAVHRVNEGEIDKLALDVGEPCVAAGSAFSERYDRKLLRFRTNKGEDVFVQETFVRLIRWHHPQKRVSWAISSERRSSSPKTPLRILMLRGERVVGMAAAWIRSPTKGEDA